MESNGKRRKSSVIWNHFSDLGDSSAYCNICKQKLSHKTSTSNLRKHLERKHPTVSVRSENTPTLILSNQQPSILQVLEAVADEVEVITTSKPEQQKRQVSNNEKDVIVAHQVTVCDDKSAVEPLRRTKRNLGSYVSAEDCLIVRTEKSLDNDEYYGYAISVSAKLRKMDEKQRLYAEKIINDAIFRGMFNQLSEQSMIFTPSTAQTNVQNTVECLPENNNPNAVESPKKRNIIFVAPK